jgi:hypothetical protein
MLPGYLNGDSGLYKKQIHTKLVTRNTLNLEPSNLEHHISAA